MAYGFAMLARISTNESAVGITRKVVEATGIDGNFCCDFILKDNGSSIPASRLRCLLSRRPVRTFRI